MEVINNSKQNYTDFYIPTLPEYINLDRFINVNEEDYEEYLDFGIKIGEIISSYLDSNETVRRAKIFKYRMNMIDDGNNTLATIGERYGITKERVRQILFRTENRFKSNPNRKIYLKQILDLISEIDKEEIFNYYVYGIINVYNKLFLRFILDFISEKYSRRVFDKIYDLILLLKSNSNKEEDKEKKVGDVVSQIKYPNFIGNYTEQFSKLKQMREVNPDNNTGMVYLPRLNKEFEYESFSEKNVLEMLDQNEDIVDIKVQSLVISYTLHNKTYNYYPDFQLLFKDGRMAIIEIKNIYSMGEHIVREKYKALKAFCEKYGIGYLMIDDRMNNYEAIKENNVDEQTKRAFMKYLETHNPMKYPDLLEFKKTTKLRTKDFVNMTINDERIIFNASPFYIRFDN